MFCKILPFGTSAPTESNLPPICNGATRHAANICDGVSIPRHSNTFHICHFGAQSGHSTRSTLDPALSLSFSLGSEKRFPDIRRIAICGVVPTRYQR